MNITKSDLTKENRMTGQWRSAPTGLNTMAIGCTQEKLTAGRWTGFLTRGLSAIAIAMAFAMLAGPALAQDEDEADEEPFGAAVVIIELTDNDIELQVFVDGTDWKRVRISDPNDRRLFFSKAQERLHRQGGMSEMFWASEPTHYLEDEPNFDGPIEDFLGRFPEGQYEFEGVQIDGSELESEATLTHVLPALPEIVAPVSLTDDPPVVDRHNVVIEWEPVTTRFIGEGPVTIIEYQVIVDAVEPVRAMPWVDGGTRRALVNLPPSVTSFTVPPEFLLPDAEYEFEILAIEASGNSTISVGEFITSPW